MFALQAFICLRYSFRNDRNTSRALGIKGEHVGLVATVPVKGDALRGIQKEREGSARLALSTDNTAGRDWSAKLRVGSESVWAVLLGFSVAKPAFFCLPFQWELSVSLSVSFSCKA